MNISTQTVYKEVKVFQPFKRVGINYRDYLSLPIHVRDYICNFNIKVESTDKYYFDLTEEDYKLFLLYVN